MVIYDLCGDSHRDTGRNPAALPKNVGSATNVAEIVIKTGSNASFSDPKITLNNIASGLSNF